MFTPVPIPTQKQLKDPLLLSDLQARIIWSIVAEPGDKSIHDWAHLAGGYVQALWLLSEGRMPDEVASVDEATDALRRWMPRLKDGPILPVFRQVNRLQVNVITPGHVYWPGDQLARLGATEPLALYVRGDASLLIDPKKIAMVGARAATGYGEHVAMEMANNLVDRGVTIVSGAAYGIDGMAHRAVLAANGRTIAVLAGGVDRFYPSGHEALLTRIVESGAVVAELPPGSQSTKWRFLQRNRIIAALSDATIVVEAGWRSGSLNTAGHAVAMEIPLGAVPGPITSAASAGCHRLIRDFDAVCITNGEEAFLLAYPDGTPIPEPIAKED